MTQQYDVITIGSGPVGNTIAPKCSSAGLNVALIESRKLGGTCPLRGCNPKKILVNAAKAIADSQNLLGKGIRSTGEIDWPELIRFKRTFTEPAPEKMAEKFKSLGVDIYHGQASFNGSNSILVGNENLTANYIVIGTGAKPRPLDIKGNEHVITSEQFFELEYLPDSIILIGGGYIAFEFAHIASRAGSKVTILEMTDSPLMNFDPDLVEMLIQSSEETGINIHTETQVRAVEKNGNDFTVQAAKHNYEETFHSKLVVHCAGRVPNIDDLSLDSANIQTSKGIQVNQYMQSVTNDQVYAAGDCVDTPFQLTPAASMEASVAAHNIIHGNFQTVNRFGVPSTVFTIPSLASVGYLEKDLAEQGIQYKKEFVDMSTKFTSKSVGIKHAGIKVLLDKDMNTILGAHLLGYHAEEVINIYAVAIRHNLSLQDLKIVPWIYPSASHDINYL